MMLMYDLTLMEEALTVLKQNTTRSCHFALCGLHIDWSNRPPSGRQAGSLDGAICTAKLEKDGETEAEIH